MRVETVQLGARGTCVLPARIRKELGLEDGSLMIVEVEGSTVKLRKAVAVPFEEYTDVRQAEFILNNAVDAPDYAAARKRVQMLGIDPDSIPHEKP